MNKDKKSARKIEGARPKGTLLAKAVNSTRSARDKSKQNPRTMRITGAVPESIILIK